MTDPNPTRDKQGRFAPKNASFIQRFWHNYKEKIIFAAEIAVCAFIVGYIIGAT